MLTVQLRQARPIPLDANFTCGAGELIALVGPSGSGKTTILRAIAGLTSVSEGRIDVGSQVWLNSADGVRLSPQQRRVGLVFQSYALFPHLTALENVAIASAREDSTQHADALLATMQLTGLSSRRPHELSGGQQQRVALARALAREPAVLLLDEPFSAVDQVTRHDLYAELAALRRSLEMPIVLVTHDLPEARTLADRLVILDGGTTLQAGEPTQVLSRPRNARVAALLGLRNHFNGVFRRSDAEYGSLEWTTTMSDASSTTLRVADKGRIDDGATVTWIIGGEHLHLQIGIAARNDENTIACEVVDLIPLGDLTQCTLRVLGAAGPRVVLALPTSHVRRGGVAVGASGTLTLDAEGIHIMPVLQV